MFIAAGVVRRSRSTSSHIRMKSPCDYPKVSANTEPQLTFRNYDSSWPRRSKKSQGEARKSFPRSLLNSTSADAQNRPDDAILVPRVQVNKEIHLDPP
jgi:hypothetical protein